MRPARRPGGFTLIEMMVVLALVGIVASIAAPSFSEYFARSRLTGAANEAYSDLQLARSESVERYTPVRITFSSTGYVIDVPSTSETIRSVTWTRGTTATTAMVVTFEPTRGTASAVANAPTVIGNTGTSASARLGVNAAGRPIICSVSGRVLGGMRSC